MKKTVTVLFLNAGRRVELIRRFKQAFDTIGLQGRVVTTDIQPWAPAFYLGDVQEILPHSSSPEFVPALKRLCQKEKVTIVVPLIDPDLLILSQHKKEFEKEGIKVLVSDHAAIQICRDKIKTTEFFKKNNCPTPRLFQPNDKPSFPVILKPRDGSASQNIYTVQSEEELDWFQKRFNNPIVQEKVEGDEITTDVFSDWTGQPYITIPRKRIKVRGGEVTVGQIQRDPELEALCRRIAQALPSVGPINIQAIRGKNSIHFIEINPRFGGGCPLSLAAGVPMAEWTLQLALDQPLSPTDIQVENGQTMMRFDDAFFFKKEELACP